MPHLILLDDEAELRDEVADYLSRQGFEVTEVGTIAEFRDAHMRRACDLAIIDRMLPDGDGMQLVAELRANPHNATLPVILFTAKDARQDRIEGYSLGADHYLIKPIFLEELGAIVGTLTRRLPRKNTWTLHVERSQLFTPAGVQHKLTTQELAFLLTLAQQPVGQSIQRRDVIAAIGKNANAYDARNLDTLLRRLRRKVSALHAPPLPVKTLHGVGYLLIAPILLR